MENDFPTPFSEAECNTALHLMHAGIEGVQALIRTSRVAPAGSLALDTSLGALRTVYDKLGVSGMVQDPLTSCQTKLVEFPRVPLVREAVLAIALSPRLSEDQREEMANAWIVNTSRGHGRTYPTKGIARIDAIGFLEDVLHVTSKPASLALQGVTAPAALLVDRLTVARPIIGKVEQLNSQFTGKLLAWLIRPTHTD